MVGKTLIPQKVILLEYVQFSLCMCETVTGASSHPDVSVRHWIEISM